ncbi:MAG: COP23 domain-containing protein [Trichodesmium sp. ALOHA_ZT_67]|nr:COP23 domain-containing protein [Trichodesmium sp. ALOHA_ZT_67]MDE5092881.1 COP23 domain-containing protein [Trichodesmium sp. St11_bin5]
MNNQLRVSLAGILATVGLLGIMPQSEAKAEQLEATDKVVFSCVSINAEENQHATVPQIVREIRDTSEPGLLGGYPLVKQEVIQVSSKPMIVWTATLSSDHPKGAYTPDRRCQSVSTRLTNLAYALGMTTFADISQIGVVNYEQVVYVSPEEEPSFDNVVFTLKPENREKSEEILTQFKDFGQGTASDEPIYE